MSIQSVKVLDFDGSVTAQHVLMHRYRPEILSLRKYHDTARFWLDSSAERGLKESLSRLEKNTVTFLGSGDYHQVSSLLISRFQVPLTVIIFDRHPDWDILPPKLHCGSWVTHLLKTRNIQKVVLVGVGEDLSTFRIQTGNLNALKNDRVEIFPWSQKSTKVFLRNVPQNRSLQVSRHWYGREIQWTSLERLSFGAFSEHLRHAIATQEIYVSVDKDCLDAEAGVSNWGPGPLSLSFLLEGLRWMNQNFNILGMDIVGDYSPPMVRSWWKQFLMTLDHPTNDHSPKFSSDEILRVNQTTNLALLEALQVKRQPDVSF